MSHFHRFCTIIPLFIAIAFLAGCADVNVPNVPWRTPTAQAPADSAPVVGPAPSTYGQAPAQAAAPSGSAIKVAILLPLTGQHAALGQSMLQAAQLAVFDLNNDHFELLSKDTNGTPNGASAAAVAAMSEGAQLIIGPLFAEEVRAVKTATSSRNINVLAFSTDWTLAGGNTYIMGFTPFAQVDRITSYAAGKGWARAAIASPADTYGTSVSRAFESNAAKYGIQISRAMSDPTTYDSVFIPAGGNALASVLPRITNTTAQKLGTGLWEDAGIAAMPAMNGALFAAPSPSARASFENRYRSTYGQSPVRIATLAYDATSLAAALAPTGYTATALKNPGGFAGIDGIMRFQSDNVMERGMAILQINNGRIVEIDPAPRAFR